MNGYINNSGIDWSSIIVYRDMTWHDMANDSIKYSSSSSRRLRQDAILCDVTSTMITRIISVDEIRYTDGIDGWMGVEAQANKGQLYTTTWYPQKVKKEVAQEYKTQR